MARMKKIRPKLTDSQKIARRKKFNDLTSAIDSARNAYQQEVSTISRRFGRSTKWTRRQLFLGCKQRRGSPWNAYVRGKLKEANEGKPVGERYRLTAFIEEFGSTLQSEYKKLSAAELDLLVKEITAVRDERARVTVANPKALLREVDSDFTDMQNQWTGLCMRTGIEGFYIAVRGSLEDFHEPKTFFSQKALQFVKEVLNIEPRELALKLEAWTVSGLDKAPEPSAKYSRSKLISECRVNIQENLDDILRRLYKTTKTIPMNYENYEGKIVEKYGVALKGWPCGEVRNPAKLGGTPAVRKLLNALKSEECCWYEMTREEAAARRASNAQREARGEIVYKSRKSQHTAKKTMKKSIEMIFSESSSDDDEDSDEN